jgi:hypothetical protein
MRFYMALMKCPHCNGKKKRNGMGFILIDCPNCNATGYVDDDDFIASENSQQKVRESNRPKMEDRA